MTRSRCAKRDVLSLAGKDALTHLDAGSDQALDATAFRTRIRVPERDDSARRPRGDDGINEAFPGRMRARLERHIDRRARGAVAGVIERDRLGMRAAAGAVTPRPTISPDGATTTRRPTDSAKSYRARASPATTLAPYALRRLRRPCWRALSNSS